MYASASEQRIEFTTTPGGIRLAYATHGRGYPLVRAAHWLTHLEHDWRSPIWHPWLVELGRRFRVLRYDERGCGLSDWNVDDFSLEAWIEDLEAVVDAAGYERFALLGPSQGAAVAIGFAARHPERVSHLIVYGGYMLGYEHRDLTELQRQEIAALHTMMRIGWGSANPVFRRLFTSQFVTDGDEELMRAYDELMRLTTSPENAVRFEEADGPLDARKLAASVSVPTLVMHLDDDQVVSFASGRAIAAAIPHARFVQLHGRNHVLLPRDEAWSRFWDLMSGFVGSPPVTTTPPAPSGAVLSVRERQVLELVSRGMTNQQIAAALGLSARTVERHCSNAYLKLGLSGSSARAAAAAWAVEARFGVRS